MSKFKKTYYTKNIESRETKRDKTEKLFTKLKKQTNRTLIEAYKKGEVILGEKRQKILGCSFKKSMKSLVNRDGSIKKL